MRVLDWAGSICPEGLRTMWRGGRGERFCFFHLDDSLIPPALIFSFKTNMDLLNQAKCCSSLHTRTTQEGKDENKISLYLKLSFKKCPHTNRCINTHIQTCHFWRKTFGSVRMLRWLVFVSLYTDKHKVCNFHPIYLILKWHYLYRDGERKKHNYPCSSSLTALTFILLFLKKHLLQ